MENILGQVNVFSAKDLVEFLTAMDDRIRALESQLRKQEKPVDRKRVSVTATPAGPED